MAALFGMGGAKKAEAAPVADKPAANPLAALMGGGLAKPVTPVEAPKPAPAAGGGMAALFANLKK